jgi:dipeptidyl-peptidase 4
MKTLVSFLAGCWLALAGATFAPAQQKTSLTIEKIFGGDLSDSAPSELRWSPDGQYLGYFLPDERGERALWIQDSETGVKTQILTAGQVEEMAPSPEQATSSERERTRRNRYGLASFIWAPGGKSILLSSAGRLFLYDLETHKATLIAPAKSGISDPQFSPDGKWIAFVYKHDLWIVPGTGGKEIQVTFGGSELLLHGEPDWIYQEEFDVRSGYSWSPDSSRIAFLELEESRVPAYPITDELSVQATVDMQRYPKAGDPNPSVRVGFVEAATRRTVWMDRTAEYVPRIDWADKNAAAIQLLNRAQNELELAEVSCGTGRAQVVLKERDRFWLDISDDLTFLTGGSEFLWTSDRSGYRHVYLYARNGKLKRQLTSGEWVVDGISGVDETQGVVYYTSNKANPLGRDLFRIRIDGTREERITKETGTHGITMNSPATAFVDSFSSQMEKPHSWIHNLAADQKLEIFRGRSLEEYGLIAPEIKELKTPDGAVVRVSLYRPEELPPGRKYPVLVYAYGMPGVPTIQDNWAGNRGLFHQFLVRQGILVAQVDDRSSSVKGHIHATAAYRNLGTQAARDHELAVRYLSSLPFVDAGALAIWGWSGGGFTAAFHLTHTRLFKAGIAGAPVTDWRLYDSIYTERYMGLPKDDPDAYDRASAILAAGNCEGKLLLIHGSQDDNVHPQNTFQMAQALIKSRKQFDLMLYPNKTHGITGASENIHMYTLIYEFLRRNL